MSSPDDRLAFSLLKWMELTIFRRLAPWNYQRFGDASPAFMKFFHAGSTGEFWKQSEMLDFFMHDVENYFSQDNEESSRISSGVWHETASDGHELSFMVQAFMLAGEQILIVRSLSTDWEYEEKVNILRRARENLLERRRLNVDLNEYRQKSRRDGLTGIFNRETFDELLLENMTLSIKNGANLALILVDVDDFKNVNDTYGHVSGDRVLSEIGQVLQTTLRPADAACRYGGDEFAILIQHATRKQVVNVAEKIRSYMEQYQFEGLPRVSVSIGYSMYQPDEAAESLIARVDTALYEAKRTGKNKAVAKWSSVDPG